MKVFRSTEFEVESGKDFMIGDQIEIGKYTATCQEASDEGAVFLLDQYIDRAYPMNKKMTNEGGYEASDLRKMLQSDEILDIFAPVRDRMKPFENGDLVRIPFVEELFGEDDYYELSDKKQWPLMKDRRNRIASREGDEYEWGWLQNKVKSSGTLFAYVAYFGNSAYGGASGSRGVRPAIWLA